MNKSTYEIVREFKKKYSMTVAWRIKQHANVIDKHLNPNEKVLYAFVGQGNDSSFDMFHTNILVFTNERIMVATKRVLFGYFFKSITPDMYNDLSISRGIIWGKIEIDTVKEVILITNVDVKALAEIETNITEIILKYKEKFPMERNKSAKK